MKLLASHVFNAMGKRQLREVTHIKDTFMICLSLYSLGLHSDMYLLKQAVSPIQISHEIHTYIFEMVCLLK